MTSSQTPQTSSQAHSATIIDGRALAGEVREETARRVAAATQPVRLDAVLVGSDRSAALYAESQRRMCAEVGIEYVLGSMRSPAAFCC